MSSDIQVFVRWKEQAIFAGEDIECTITFKNVAPEGPGAERNGPSSKHSRGGSRPVNAVIDGTNYSPAKSFNLFSLNSHRRPASTGHRPRQTLETTHRHSVSAQISPPTYSQSFPPATPAGGNTDGTSSRHRHKRSVSIISVGTDTTSERGPGPFSPKSPWSHARSASLQVPSRRDEIYVNGSPRSPVSKPQPPEVTPGVSGKKFPHTQTRSPSIVFAPSRRKPKKQPSALPTDFKFPQAPPTPDEAGDTLSSDPSNTAQPKAALAAESCSNTNDSDLEQSNKPTPATEIISTCIVDGSTRSSAEFCSMSNNSTETIESEYVSYHLQHPRLPVRHRRHFSSLEPARRRYNDQTQSLLMGYAQINASFTIDGSLINHSLFEDVKRKGVVGTPGRSDGPVKSRGGFLGSLGLGALSDSIGGLLSGGELEGLRDMRGVTSSQSIPLLSTPQSLLFVDLQLGPGEEKSFLFSFTLPKGLPASHKGKAIKISYNLIIGTQKAGTSKEVQRVRRINIPFRVLSGVDERGRILGHDIMRPYILLRDEARVQKLEPKSLPSPKAKSIGGRIWSSSDFLSYVDEILDQRERGDSVTATTAPSETRATSEFANEHFSCKDAIDLAILRSNRMSSDRSANRFEVSRSGRRIAVIVLNRPAHRLGEVVVATIDFTDAGLPCYSVRGSLETSEKVDPAIALRSGASIARATRRVYATCFENTLFSRKVVFTFSIPMSATPSFITSGVSLDWQIRFEFVTCALRDENDVPAASGVHLLERVEQDDRGTVLTSLEGLPCQSFEIGIPLTVYGGSAQDPGSEESQGIPI
ncbi:hypothetical protein VTO42DRAFT_1207 [Malbranchea cinnamomea]